MACVPLLPLERELASKTTRGGNLPRSMLRRQHVAPYNLWTRYGTLIAFADEVGDAIQRGRFPVDQRQLQCNHGCGSTASDDAEFRYLHISVRSPNRSS